MYENYSFSRSKLWEEKTPNPPKVLCTLNNSSKNTHMPLSTEG